MYNMQLKATDPNLVFERNKKKEIIIKALFVTPAATEEKESE